MFRRLFALLLPVTLLVGGPPVPKERGPRTAQWRNEIAARLHQLRVDRLQQTLGVPAEKARSIADRWAQFDGENRNQRHRLRQLHEQVNSLLLSPLPEEEKNTRIRPLVEQFSALRQQQQELKRKFEEDIRSSLTPAQQGRFLLVVEELQRALGEAIKAQRSGASGQ